MASLRETVKEKPCKKHEDDIRESKAFHKELLQTKVDNLPCKKHGYDIEEVKQIGESTIEMLVYIKNWVMKRDPDMIDTLAQKASPLKMTPLGELFLEVSSAKKAVDNHLDYLIGELEKTKPRKPYDVDENSASVLSENTGGEIFDDIKQYLYESPDIITLIDPESKKEQEIKLSMHLVIRLMGIYLRDKYFERHPDIK
ncbi:hypothetical protein Barb6_01494 [Bacteroidales bacterium Barb6]|nr:hypothetical protein Barb6_01494 [Bacteroidales bacterium Barb6]